MVFLDGDGAPVGIARTLVAVEGGGGGRSIIAPVAAGLERGARRLGIATGVAPLKLKLIAHESKTRSTVASGSDRSCGGPYG